MSSMSGLTPPPLELQKRYIPKSYRGQNCIQIVLSLPNSYNTGFIQIFSFFPSNKTQYCAFIHRVKKTAENYILSFYCTPPPFMSKCRNMHCLSIYLSIIDRQKRNTKHIRKQPQNGPMGCPHKLNTLKYLIYGCPQ